MLPPGFVEEKYPRGVERCHREIERLNKTYPFSMDEIFKWKILSELKTGDDIWFITDEPNFVTFRASFFYVDPDIHDLMVISDLNGYFHMGQASSLWLAKHLELKHGTNQKPRGMTFEIDFDS